MLRGRRLRALPGAAERLKLVEADLLGGPASLAAFTAAFSGSRVVFHTACPFVVTARAAELGEEFFVEPAVQGTLRVLEAAAAVGSVARVVLTSSTAAILEKDVPEGHVYDERETCPRDTSTSACVNRCRVGTRMRICFALVCGSEGHISSSTPHDCYRE